MNQQCLNPSRTRALCIALLWVCLGHSDRSNAQTIPAWKLVWADEFSQADGSPPNPANWGFDIGGGGWGNGESQYYTDRTNNARIEGGCLIIEAHEESYGGNDYTSARLTTEGKRGRSWAYGRMEARIQLPYGQGIWPAFWMLGTDFSAVGWPDCGEIDIMENVGFEPQTAHGTVHGPFSWGGHWASGGAYTNLADLAEGFHLYAIEWETNVIRWFFDDIPYFTATPTNIGGGDWVFDHPHFLLMNIAVGGSWPGSPDSTTLFPQRMSVDYVRVYARTSVAPFLATASLVGDQIQITFQTQDSVLYQVASKTNLSEAGWIPVETLLGDGTTRTVSYPVADPARFYVVRQP